MAEQIVYDIPRVGPYLGAAYYPEDWPLDQVDADIALMKQAGMNIMRIGEFAWSRMEPKEGQFDFEWLQTVVDKLGRAGIAVVMGTPTCTPPVWLVEKYPEVLFVNEAGTPMAHGARRHACPNSPVYRHLCARITRKMGEEFGRGSRHEGAIIGWQIDNEVYPTGGYRACCCPTCVDKFHRFLEERYGTIEALNAAWCLTLWSQEYGYFHQVPTPRPDIWHHPALLAAWDEFTSRSYCDFVKDQADILHELTDVPIGTDMMPFAGIDHTKMNAPLDVVQFNHYNILDNLWETAFWFDYFRPMKDRPFWNTETATNWSGATAIWHGWRPEGFCRINSWLPIALGGEANLYWLWRQHWAGQELMHGAVISSAGRPMHIYGEVQEIARGYGAAAEFLNTTRPTRTGLALHYSHHAHFIRKNQQLISGFNYQETLIRRVYHPLIQAQLRPDVIHPMADLAPYRVILSPFQATLDEEDLRARLKTWIEAGGTWITGPQSDIRTFDGSKFTHAPFGSLEEWTGAYCRFTMAADPQDFKLRWEAGALAGIESVGWQWYDAFEPREAEALATYTEGPMAGLAAVVRMKMGKGQIIVLGTMPPAEIWQKVVLALAGEAGVAPVADASANLMVVPRENSNGQPAGVVVAELENKPARLKLDREATDLLSGRRLSGEVEVEPMAVLVLRY